MGRQVGGRGSILLALAGREHQLTAPAFIRFSHLVYPPTSPFFPPPLFPLSSLSCFLLVSHPFLHLTSWLLPLPLLTPHHPPVLLQRCSQVERLWSIPHVSFAASKSPQNGGGSKTAGRQTIAGGCFDSGEELRVSQVSVKGVTALNNTSQFDLPPFLESNSFLFPSILTVSWLFQHGCHSLPSSCLPLPDMNTSLQPRCPSFFLYLAGFPQKSCRLPVLSIPLRHRFASPVSPFSLLLWHPDAAPRSVDWRTDSIMADMTRQVRGDTRVSHHAVTAPHGWQHPCADFPHTSWHMHKCTTSFSNTMEMVYTSHTFPELVSLSGSASYARVIPHSDTHVDTHSTNTLPSSKSVFSTAHFLCPLL